MMDVIVLSAPGGIDLALWRRVREGHGGLLPIETFSEVKPFTRATRTLLTPESAAVVAHGKVIGHLFWDESRLLTPLEFEERRTELESVARAVALSLGASVSIVDDDELEIKPREGV